MEMNNEKNIQNNAIENSSTAIEFAMKLNKKLDYSYSSIKTLEEILDYYSNDISKSKPTENQIRSMALIFGSYLGEVMLRNGLSQKGYKWGYDNNSDVPLLISDEGYITPNDKVYKRLVNGKQDSVISFYNFVMDNNKFDITIHRKISLKYALTPLYVVFDYDVEAFMQLINKYNKKEITHEQINAKLKEIKIVKILNNEKKKFEFSNKNVKVFVTNMNIENTKLYPFICSNQLTIDKKDYNIKIICKKNMICIESDTLKQELSKLQSVVIKNDIGEFYLNRDFSMFESEINWLSGKCNLHLKTDDENGVTADKSFEIFHKIFDDMKNFDEKVRGFASEKLVSLANEWNEEATNVIDNETFMKRMSLLEIEVDDEYITFYFEDDDMFLGHAIVVIMTSDFKCQYATIAG